MPNVNQLPDAFFYYGLAIFLIVVLVIVLLWVGKRFVALLDKLSNDVTEVKATQQLHTQVLKTQDEDIKTLKKKVFPIQYGSR